MSRTLINTLKAERKKLVDDARGLLNAADTEKRELTAEQNTQYETIMADADKRTARIEQEERLLEAELRNRSTDPENKEKPPVEKDGERKEVPKELRDLHMQALRTLITEGPTALTSEQRKAVTESHSLMEVREMSAFASNQSVMLAPQEFTNQIIKDLEKVTAVRELASIFSVNTLAGIGVPTDAEDTEEAEMTAELTAPSAASDLTLGLRELRPHQSSKLIKLPTTLLQSARFPVESLASEKLGPGNSAAPRKMKYNTGSGAQEPLGLFTASAFGIDTDRDVVCGSATNYTWDGIIDIEAALREEYRSGAKFLLPRNGQTRLRKLKDGEGRYIWEPSVRQGEPDRILGYEYKISDYTPGTFTSGQYVGMFGDFKYYWIIEFAFTYVQKLVELYALTNQIALIGRRWFDGAPVQPKAFVRMKLG